MPNLRLFLLLGLFAVGFLLWNQWQIDYGAQRPAAGGQPTPSGDRAAPDLPRDLPPDDLPRAADVPPAGDVPAPSASAAPAAPPREDAGPGEVRVLTDVLDVSLSLRGGTVERANLRNYPVKVDSEETVRLLASGARELYLAQSGLLSDSAPAPNHTDAFSAERRSYRLTGGADELVVPLTWEADGITVMREYVFRPGRYTIEVRDRVTNRSDKRWTGRAYRQLQRTPPPPVEGSTFTHPERFSFVGPAFYTPEEKYNKFDFDEVGIRPEEATASGLWLAMVQHYFIAAWIPPEDAQTTVQIARIPDTNRFVARAFTPAFAVEPGGTGTSSATLFVGPKLQDRLDDIAEGLALTVDYGIFTPFSKVLFWLLSHIHALVGNWGWAIVLLTVLVKAAFYKLTEAQYRSMAKLRKLQPRIQALKERYGDDKQQFNMKMMEIYKKEKVNPLGGCLPVLIQIPVFIALYWVLVESVELRQAPFMLWIDDLSSPDPYFILPLINGAAMFMTTKLSPNPAADPIQQKIMLSMPIVFSVMFAFFQAGLVLYWAVNAVLSLAQQWFITKRIEAQA